MRRYFYVDTENRGIECWAHHMHLLQSTDTLYLFYTGNSPKVPMNMVTKIHECTAVIKLIYAKNGTANALDFTLVTVLAQRVLSAPKSAHYIISADKGYQAAIDYHLQHKLDVSQHNSLLAVLQLNHQDSISDISL